MYVLILLKGNLKTSVSFIGEVYLFIFITVATTPIRIGHSSNRLKYVYDLPVLFLFIMKATNLVPID